MRPPTCRSRGECLTRRTVMSVLARGPARVSTVAAALAAAAPTTGAPLSLLGLLLRARHRQRAARPSRSAACACRARSWRSCWRWRCSARRRPSRSASPARSIDGARVAPLASTALLVNVATFATFPLARRPRDRCPGRRLRRRDGDALWFAAVVLRRLPGAPTRSTSRWSPPPRARLRRSGRARCCARSSPRCRPSSRPAC